MDVGELERAFRQAIQRDSAQVALAAIGGSGQTGLHLPAEFEAAVKTLAGRSQKPDPERSILRTIAQVWI